ncbi:MAG: InlB B-repeat-containing protein, partial [Limisphaerales bacterium]
SNVWLRIGQNYKITASPARGFKFAEWVTSTNFAGGTTTNKPTVQFTMASNLTLQAIFAETARPTLRILSPTSGAREPNTTATLTGTASDFWGLAMVAYQLNGGPSQLASSANAFRNWTANVQLNPGTNFLSIYAMNLGGIFSTTNKLTLISTNAVAMQFRLISRAKSGAGFNFTVRLTPGLSGRIQVSTNLINWNTLTNFAETNGIMSIYDPEATRPQRFYRVVAP